MSTAADAAKRAVAYAAADRVSTGARLGLGTGSTFVHVLDRLAARQRDEGLEVAGVPTSEATAEAARRLGIRLLDLDEVEHLDVAIDGADEVGPGLALIKGGGGALTREKIVASAARSMIAIVHRAKIVDALGAFPLPVEVLPFGWSHAARRIASLGCEPALRTHDGAPFRTDSGNLVLDCPFGSIEDPERTAMALERIPGVVEHGLFLGLATTVLVANPDGSIDELT